MNRYLIIGVLMLAGYAVTAQLTYQRLQVNYDSAWTYKNCKIIPIRPKGPGAGNPGLVSFSQAMQQGLITVTERGTASTENVHWLRINNMSNQSVLINSGEIVLGGRQDRMVSKDTVLGPSARDQYIPVMCVEEGRWSEKEKKIGYYGYANPQLRKVLDRSQNQVVVWREIANELDSCKIKSPTLAYAARRLDKKHNPQQEEYMRYFVDRIKKSDSTIVGFICVSGDKIIGCDAYAGTDMFYGQLLPLLSGYVEDAIAYGKPPVVTNEQVKKYMDKILTDEQSQEEYLKKNGKLYRYNKKVIHLTGYGQ